MARAKQKVQTHGVVEAALGLNTGNVLGQHREMQGDKLLLEKGGMPLGQVMRILDLLISGRDGQAL